MNSIIVVVLFSFISASAQTTTATSKAAQISIDGGPWMCGSALCPQEKPKKKAKPKPSVKKKCHEASDIGWHLGDPQACQITLPECTKNNCEMLDAKGTQEYDGILCPESEPNCRDRSTELPTMAKPQEGPKKSVDDWSNYIVTTCAMSGQKSCMDEVCSGRNGSNVNGCPNYVSPGAAPAIKDDPSKLCDALSPTEKITCLMNAIAPAAPDESKPDMPATLLMQHGVHECTYAFEADCRFAYQVKFDGTLNRLLFTQWDKDGKIYTISTDGYACHALADSDPKAINADSLIIECRRTR